MYAVLMTRFPRSAFFVRPAMPPLDQCFHHRQQVGAFVGEQVLLPGALAALPVVLANQNALLDEATESGRCDGLADSDSLYEVAEPRRAAERFMQDQEG